MPAALIKGRLHKKCEVCQSPNASFGFGVNLREALRQKELKNINRARENLGKWYCNEHKGVV